MRYTSPIRPLLLIAAACLLTACGRPLVTCTGDDTKALLAQTFKSEVTRILTSTYGDLSAPARKATDPIMGEFAGLRETKNDNGHSCTGEALVSVKLDPAVALRLADPVAAIYMPGELGDVNVVGNELRGSVQYALVAGSDGQPPTVDTSKMIELASTAAMFTMQVVSERSLRAETAAP